MKRSTARWMILIIMLAILAVLIVGYVGESKAQKSEATCDVGFSIGKTNFCYGWTIKSIEYNRVNGQG
jgi:hypothetical protein